MTVLLEGAVFLQKKSIIGGHMSRKYGLSFSWKRAIGLSGLKTSIARQTGIPLTKSGWERKIGRILIDLFFK